MLIQNKISKQMLELFFDTGKRAVKGAISCLLRVYGSADQYTYPKMFDEDYLIGKISCGELKVFTGVIKDGTAVVTLSVKHNPGERALEIISLAVDPKYRGFGLGEIITEHLISECMDAGNSLFYALMVVYHTKSAVVYERKGFIPTGFLMGVCDARKHCTQMNITSQKHSWAVYVKNSENLDIGTIYIPSQLTGFVRQIYSSLRAAPNIISGMHKAADTSFIKYEQDEYHKTLYAYAMECGYDLIKKMEIIEQNYTDELQTVVLFVRINDPSAEYGFTALSEAGYRFTGLKPLCGDHEYLIMSKTKAVIVDKTKFRMTDSLRHILERTGEGE